MIGQILSDLNTVIGISAAFLIVEQTLTTTQRKHVSRWLQRTLSRATPIAPQASATKITAAILSTLAPGCSWRNTFRIAAAALLAMLSIGMLSIFTVSEWKDALYLNVQTSRRLMLLMLTLLGVLIAVVVCSFLAPLLVSILRYTRSRFAFPVFLWSTFALSGLIYVTVRALVIAPATIVVAYNSAATIPLELAVEPTFAVGKLSPDTVSLKLTRVLSEEESRFLRVLQVSRVYQTRIAEQRVDFYSFRFDAVHRANNAVQLFHTLSETAPAVVACGKSAAEIVRNILNVSEPGILGRGLN